MSCTGTTTVERVVMDVIQLPRFLFITLFLDEDVHWPQSRKRYESNTLGCKEDVAD